MGTKSTGKWIQNWLSRLSAWMCLAKQRDWLSVCVCVCVEDGYSPTTMVLYDMGLEFCDVLKIGIFQCTMSVGDRVPACICWLYFYSECWRVDSLIIQSAVKSGRYAFIHVCIFMISNDRLYMIMPWYTTLCKSLVLVDFGTVCK